MKAPEMDLPVLRVVDDDHARIAYACASWLLGYPDERLVGQLPAITELAHGLPSGLGDPLLRTATALAERDAISTAELYVDTFDTRRRGCLYLTYYSDGDTRRRGMALIQIRSIYRRAGVEAGDDELPDHLSVVLEFAAGTSLRSGVDILVANRASVELLREHLVSIASPWLGALEAVCATLPAMSPAEIEEMISLAADGPPDETVGLDGYGASDIAQSIYPASRPGPTFDPSGCQMAPVTTEVEQ